MTPSALAQAAGLYPSHLPHPSLWSVSTALYWGPSRLVLFIAPFYSDFYKSFYIHLIYIKIIQKQTQDKGIQRLSKNTQYKVKNPS